MGQTTAEGGNMEDLGRERPPRRGAGQSSTAQDCLLWDPKFMGPKEETQVRPPGQAVGIGNQKHPVKSTLRWMDAISCGPRFWWHPRGLRHGWDGRPPTPGTPQRLAAPKGHLLEQRLLAEYRAQMERAGPSGSLH